MLLPLKLLPLRAERGGCEQARRRKSGGAALRSKQRCVAASDATAAVAKAGPARKGVDRPMKGAFQRILDVVDCAFEARIGAKRGRRPLQDDRAMGIDLWWCGAHCLVCVPRANGPRTAASMTCQTTERDHQSMVGLPRWWWIGARVRRGGEVA